MRGPGAAPFSRSVWPWLVAANLAGFAAQHIEIGGRALLDLAVPSGDEIDAGELWRPLTSLFVHPGGWIHLGINTGLLLLTGSRAEALIGSRRFLATYIGAGFSANALRYVVGGRQGGGASAAIFAAAGAAGARALIGSNHRLGGGWFVGATAATLIGGGLLLAATVGDNHVLALGLGVVGGQAADGDGRDSFRRTMMALCTGGFLAMAARSLVS